MEKDCKYCGVELIVGDNIPQGRVNWYQWWCRSCDNEKQRSNKTQSKNYRNKKYKDDPVIRYSRLIRSRLSESMRQNLWRKNNILKPILGVESLDEWKNYIESLWGEGMSWENYGKWTLDHKIELHTGKTIEDINRLNHHTNIQPLWKEVNSLKHNLNRVILTKEEVVVRNRENNIKSKSLNKHPTS
jgi:hypothetical protein